MKKILKIIAGALGGGVIGLAIVALIIWLIDGDEAFNTLREHKDVGALKLVLSIVYSLVAMAMAVILQFALHELGHLLGGLATGYKFVSIRLYRFTLVKEQDRLRLKQFDLPGTGGQCIMTLPDDTDSERVPYFWFNAGGVLTNLLLVAGSAFMLMHLECPKLIDALLFQMAFVGTLFALINGIPLKPNGMSNDGRNILILSLSRQERRYYLRTMQIAGALSQGTRLKEMPREWFDENSPENAHQTFSFANRLNYICWLEDQGRFEEARSMCEELQAWDDKQLPLILRIELTTEQITLELLTSCRKEVIAKLWTPQVKKCIEIGSRYASPKMVARLAIALLYDKDELLAAELYNELLRKRHLYLMPSEVETSLYLADCLKQKKDLKY
ncbi:MAG: hypothetical protein Q4B58_06455 [Bacteroidales bacterium]|nr:hypothetical protein [Bacteroidales bacterium]